MTRGELARATGANPETVRFYERIGLMPEPARTSAGHRVYNKDDARRLQFILRGRGLGFSVDQVRGLLELVDSETVTCEEVKAVTIRHLEDVRAKIADLNKLQTVLAQTAEQCTGGVTPECPVIDALADGFDLASS